MLIREHMLTLTASARTQLDQLEQSQDPNSVEMDPKKHSYVFWRVDQYVEHCQARPVEPSLRDVKPVRMQTSPSTNRENADQRINQIY